MRIVAMTYLSHVLLWSIACALWCIPAGATAGVSGSIEGRILDKATMQPLIGANIAIVGTTTGTVSDRDGLYRFQNIRAGSYDLRFSAVGYATLILRMVGVRIDLRTRIDVSLEQSVTELQPIEITADMPLIQKDQGATAYSISSGKFTTLPVSTYEEVLSLQPGTTVDGHVRGGKTNEVTYLVDGLPVQDVFAGNAGTSLPKSSVGTMTMYIGGFSAQYGNAMSGIVNIVTRGGTNTHQFFARVETDNLLPSSVNKQTDRWKEVELAANGPIIKDRLMYYTANTFTMTDTRWWQDFEQILSSPISKEFSGLSKLDYIVDKSTRATVQGIYSVRQWHDYEFSWRYNLNGLPKRERDSYRVTAIVSHTLSENSFFTASLSNYYVRNVIGDQYDADTLHPFQYDFFYRYIVGGNRFWHADHQQNILTLKGDYSTLYDRTHMVTAGFQVNRYTIASTLEKYDPQYSYFGKPLEDKPLLATLDDYTYHPWSGSAYVQDKVEFTSDGSTLDFGCRWDVLDPAVSYPVIAYTQQADKSFSATVSGTKRASVKSQLSPRIAVTLPTSPANMIYVNFGIYYQNPLFEYLYAGLTPSQIKTGTLTVAAGNPDLEPEKTIAWEVGYKHSIGMNLVASGAYFQKTVRNQLDTKTLVPTDSKVAGDYGFASYVNSAQAQISGFEAMLSREGDDRISGSVSYTYMVTEGTSEYVDQSLNYLQWGFPLYPQPYPLSWDQRHTLKADCSALLFGDIRANATASYNTGRPYTFFPTRDGFTADNPNKVFLPNNARMDGTMFVNIKVMKKFRLDESSQSSLTVSFDVRNVFNKQNVQWVDSNGRIGGELNDPSAYYEPRRARIGISAEF
jgi:outer membrane receptor protein involved in Fe transport